MIRLPLKFMDTEFIISVCPYKEITRFPVETSHIRTHLSTLERLHSEGKFVVGFAGAHGIANSLYAAIDAVSGLKKDNVVFVLVGTGPEKERLIEYTKQHQIENVLFLPPVNKKLIPSLLEHMDALYIGG